MLGVAEKIVAADKKIPVSIGFSNWSGDDLSPLLKKDVAILAPLFANAVVPAVGQVPHTPILFLYAHFNEGDGYIRGAENRGVRQIVQATNARLGVIASPISGEAALKAGRTRGPKTANIVFTLNRNGDRFGAFFKALFERMRNGEDMLWAWVQLAPQTPRSQVDNPAMILDAGAGKLMFPQGGRQDLADLSAKLQEAGEWPEP